MILQVVCPDRQGIPHQQHVLDRSAGRMQRRPWFDTTQGADPVVPFVETAIEAGFESLHLAAERVVLARPEEAADVVDLSRFSAAVVMSHHLPSDLGYLRMLAETEIPYVGLLGPAPRREKLLADLGDGAQRLRARLHAPVGLALGGRTPESIALAIVAEIHAFVHGADGRPFG